MDPNFYDAFEFGYVCAMCNRSADPDPDPDAQKKE